MGVVLIKSGASIRDALVLMKKTATEYAYQTEALADSIKNKNHSIVMKKLFNHLMDNFKYSMEHDEQVRTPARSWKDRNKGIDCDCFCVYIASVLYNLHIPYSFRVVEYRKSVGYEHVYIIAHTNQGDIPIDPVAKLLGKELPYIKAIDYL